MRPYLTKQNMMLFLIGCFAGLLVCTHQYALLAIALLLLFLFK